MRRFLTSAFRLIAKIFFRRIEQVGLEHFPGQGPVLFAVNHPNGLIDPLFLLCFAPRPVSFLAKAPLVTMPVVGWFARAFDTIPVYRRQDGLGMSGNADTFRRARAILASSGAIAIFPEGTTHSDPQLRELKTGAARIALGAALDEVSIVPTGIYYTSKHTFRSAALVVYGPPITVPRTGPEGDEPSAAAVDALTARIDAALDAVTLQADSKNALELVARAEDIFSGSKTTDLAEELELRRRFVDGYRWLRERDPERLMRLESHVIQVDAESVAASRPSGSSLLFLLLLAPVAIVGTVIHWLPYRLVGVLSRYFSHGEREMVATVKLLAGILIFPLLWLLCAGTVAWRVGAPYALITLIAVPMTGYSAMRFGEGLDALVGWWRAVSRRDIAVEQTALRQEFLDLAEEMESNQ